MALEDFPEQEQVVQLLQRSLDRGRLAHAYLFAGHSLDELEGIARALAKTLNCQQPVRNKSNGPAIDSCDECLSCRKIDHDNHADVHWVRAESKSRVILIDQMRELMQEINLKSTEAEYKVAVIVAADRLKMEAANAFLKTLEEPPPKSIFILLTTEPQRILETILSRCLRLNFAGESSRKLDAAQTAWLTELSESAAVEQKGLLGRYRLLGVLLKKLAELKVEIEKSLTARSPLERYPDVEPALREKWEEELTAAIEAEYRRQRADLLLGLQWWLRDVWLEALALKSEDRSTESQSLRADKLLNFPKLASVGRVAARITASQAGKTCKSLNKLNGCSGRMFRKRLRWKLVYSVKSVSLPGAKAPRHSLTRQQLYALVFGLFLGLAIVKFGNPIILDHKITPPASLSELWADSWPTYWGNWLLLLLVLPGVWLAITVRPRWPGVGWLWVLPTVWFGWQLVSATQTVDRTLTQATVWHFAGCLVCYFLALVLGNESTMRWLLVGVLAAFAFCLVRAVNQRLVEFPRDRQVLLEGERNGWTNFPPDVLQQMKRDGFIITTNGMDVTNPVIMAKYEKGRVHGTLVYPNALAGIVLLLWPLTLALAVNSTHQFRPLTRVVVIIMTFLLGGAGLFWTGSKSGWLIAVAIGGASVFRLNWSKRWKWMTLVTLVVVGLAVFAFRFHGYFAKGATSIGARFDYWRAAVRNTEEHPLFGSGPGTFQRPYARLKSADAEMARLTHNDYLEQFSDSGIIGGISYTAWIGLLLLSLGRRIWGAKDTLLFAVFTGLSGWGLQGLVEFGLYIPALAWPAFSILGCLMGWAANHIDNRPTTH